jgi:hypothetical protein
MRRVLLPLLVAAAIALPIAAIATSVIAAEPVTATYDLPGVTKLDVGGPATVTISIGTPEQLVVTALDEDLDQIDVERDDDRLAVEFDGGVIFNREPEGEIQYDITVASLEELELHGAVSAIAEGVTGENLDLDLSGASEADFSGFDITSLNAGLSGSSNVEITGSAETQDVDVSGASDYTASELDSRFVTVEASGASAVIIRATESLQIDASGASTVEYVAPEGAAVTMDESGSSTIRALPFTPLPVASPVASPQPAVTPLPDTSGL